MGLMRATGTSAPGKAALAHPGPEGFEAFFEGEHAHLFAALWLLTRNRHEAEEILQDSFLKLWERWDQVSGLEDPTGYLYRTAMNGFRSRSRKAAVALRRVTGSLPPDDDIARVEQREVIVRALGTLTPRQRAAVVLIDILDYASSDAAELLGITPSTIRVLLSRGRAQLRTAIGAQHD